MIYKKISIFTTKPKYIIMKANELRIGNYVRNMYGRKIFSIIDGIDYENVYLKNTITVDYIGHDDIEPIPLTEDWLKKLGFKENSFSLVWENKRIGVIDCEILKIANCDIEFPIKYVHQLQNLYFALTGEELSIKD